VFWKSLHIHHVRYRSEGGAHTQDNLLTLCDDCHREVHSDKKLYQNKCLELIKAREAGRFYLLQDILDDE
jgi:5-methylcytosine-specific restriction endonuclease McrA